MIAAVPVALAVAFLVVVAAKPWRYDLDVHQRCPDCGHRTGPHCLIADPWWECPDDRVHRFVWRWFVVNEVRYRTRRLTRSR